MESSATVRVDKATSDLLLGPDWTMNMEICDSINSDPGLAKEVVKSVKKRLQHKNPRVQLLALTLLETMIKNCGDFIHFQVFERDILQEMIKIVKKKTDMEVRDKILVLLDSWQEAFGGSGGKYPQYFWAYTDLKRSGVEFPHHPSDATLLITSPTHQAAIVRTPYVGHGVPSDFPMRLHQAMTSESANLSLSDLERIRSVMELLNDMLKAVNPHDHEAVEDEVIKELVDQCRSNQKRILQLIESTGDEELLGQGLALNDNLQTLLAKHDAIASSSSFPKESSESAPPSSPLFASATTAANSFEEDEEEDEFTQLARRNLKMKSTSTEMNAPTASKQSSDESSSSTGIQSLALPDPPPPIKTSANDQNIIDLLRATLSSNSSPSHTPITPHAPSPTFQQNGSARPFATNVHGNSQSPQTHPIPFNSYAARWAAAPPPSFPQPQPSSSPPQPQFLFRPEQQPQYTNYPPPPWEDVPSTNPPNPFAQSTYMMEYNSLGVVAGEAQPNSNYRPTEPEVSHKPFVPSYRLFEELVDSNNSHGALKDSSTSGQGMGYSGK